MPIRDKTWSSNWSVVNDGVVSSRRATCSVVAVESTTLTRTLPGTSTRLVLKTCLSNSGSGTPAVFFSNVSRLISLGVVSSQSHRVSLSLCVPQNAAYPRVPLDHTKPVTVRTLVSVPAGTWIVHTFEGAPSLTSASNAPIDSFGQTATKYVTPPGMFPPVVSDDPCRSTNGGSGDEGQVF